MSDAPEESKRFLGFPVGPGRSGQRPEQGKRFLGFPVGPGRSGPRQEETARILGFPAGLFGPVDLSWFRTLVHPIRGVKRWRRNKVLGPFASDDDIVRSDRID